ncbi:MAG: NAD-dependent epimerase/dehydratase family protein, partial [Candidatus Omnitrophica bacterium]|nr:NAD-dependent epimerase/dehydratase family protein [Candidatus Omnitrophota bacterium]
APEQSWRRLVLNKLGFDGQLDPSFAGWHYLKNLLRRQADQASEGEAHGLAWIGRLMTEGGVVLRYLRDDAEPHAMTTELYLILSFPQRTPARSEVRSDKKGDPDLARRLGEILNKRDFGPKPDDSKLQSLLSLEPDFQHYPSPLLAEDTGLAASVAALESLRDELKRHLEFIEGVPGGIQSQRISGIAGTPTNIREDLFADPVRRLIDAAYQRVSSNALEADFDRMISLIRRMKIVEQNGTSFVGRVSGLPITKIIFVEDAGTAPGQFYSIHEFNYEADFTELLSQGVSPEMQAREGYRLFVPMTIAQIGRLQEALYRSESREDKKVHYERATGEILRARNVESLSSQALFRVRYPLRGKINARAEVRILNFELRQRAEDLGKELATGIDPAAYRDHVQKILQLPSNQVYQALLEIDRSGGLAKALPFIDRMKAKPRYGEGISVFGHSFEILRRAHELTSGDMAGFMTDYVGWKFDPETAHAYAGVLATATSRDRELLNLIILLHDLGVLVQGAQHAAVGSEMIPAILEKLGLDRDEAKLVTWVVNHHIDLSTLQSGERRIFYHALEELPPVLRDRATRFLALLSIAESRAVYQPERDQGKFIEKMNAVFYLDAMNPEKLEGLREHFGEYRLERFSALGGDAGPVDEEKHRKVLDIIERDLPRTERPQFDLAMQEIIEVFDYANFFLQSLDAGAMVKILYLFSQIEKKYENRFSEIIFNAPTAEAHRAAQNVQPVLHGYDFAALTLGSKEFDRILELLAITVDTENGQINVNNHQFVEASAVPSLPRSEIRLPPPAGEAGDGQKREGAETDATRTSEVSPQEQSAAKETRYRQAMATLLQKWGAESLDSEMLSDLTSEEIASLGLDDEIFFESVTSFSEADQRTIRNDIIRQALFRAGKDQCDYQKVHRLVRDAVIYDADPGNRYLLRKMMTHTVLFIALSSLGVFATLWFMPVSWHSIWLNLLALPVVVMVLHLTHVLLNDDASKENETDLGRIAAFNIAAVIILLSISRGVLLGILNSLVAAVNFYLVRNYVLRISEEDMPFSRPPFFLMSSSYVIAKKSLLRSDVYRHAVPLGIYLSKNVPAGLGAEFDEVFRLANAYFETGSKRALEAQLIYYKLRRWFWGSYSDEAAMAAIVAAVDGKMGRESADEMMHAMLGGGWRKVLERLAQTAMREEAGSGEGKTSRTSARGDSVPVQEETRAVGQAVSQRNGEVVRDIEILRREFEPSYPWSFVYQELAELLNAVPRNTQAIAHLLRDINWLLDFLRANFASEEMRSPYAHRALVNQISHRLFDGTANPQNVYVDNRAIRMAALIGLSSSGQYKAGMNSVYVTDLSARDRAYRAISDYIMSETESTERSESRLAKRQTQDTSPKTPDRIARDKGDVSSFENSKLETLNPELNQVRSETRTPDSQDAQTDGGFYGVFYRDEATDGPETKLVPVTEGMRKDILHLIRPDVLWTPDTAQGEPFTVTHKKRHGHPRGAAYLDRNQSAIVKSIERLQTALGRPVKLALYEYSFHTAQPVPRHLMMRRDDYDVFGLAGFARAPGDLVSFRDAEGTVHMPIDYFVPGLDPDMQHELAVEAVMAALATDQESLLRDLREHSRRVLFHSDRFALPLSDQLERQMPPEKTIPLLAAVMRFEILWNEVLWQLPPAETDLTPHEKTIKLLTLQTIGMGFTHARQIGAEVLGGFLEKWFTPKMAKAICDYVRNSSVNEGIALGMEDFRLAMRHDAVMGFFHATETLRSLAEQAPVEESPTAMTKTEWDLLGKLEEMWHEQRAMPPDEMLDAILQKHDVLLVQAQPEHVADFMPLLQRSGNLPAKSLVAFPLIPRSREDSLVEKLWARRVFFGEATWKDIARAVNAYLIDGNPEPLRHLTTQRDEKRFDQVIAHFRSFRRLNQRGAGIRYFPSFELHDLDSTVTTSAELEARMRVYLTDLTEYRAETGSEKMVLLQELPVTLHVGPQILHLQKQGPNDEDLLQKLAKSKDFFGAEDVAAATAVHVTYDLAKVDPRASLPKVFSQWNRGSFGSEVDDSFGLMCVAPNELPGYPYIFYNFQYVLIFALIKKPGGGEAHAGSPAPDPSLAVYPPGHDLEDTVVSGSRQRSESRETVGSRQQNVQRKTYSGEHPSVVRSRSYVTDQRSELRAKDKVPVMPKRRGRGLALWQKINRKFPNGGFTIDQLQAMRGMGRIGNRETLLSLIKLFEDLELVTRQREEVTPKSKGRPYVIRISDRVRKLKPQNIEELEFVLSGCTTRRADFAYVQPQVRRILGGERLFRLRKTQTGLFFDYHQKEKALKKKDPRITHPYLYITFCQLRKLFGQEWVNIGAFRERVKGIDRDTLALHINQFDDWGLVERGRVDKSGQGEWVRLACDPTRLDRVEAALLAGSMKGEEYRTGYTVRQILNGKQTLADKLQPPVTADPFGVVYSVTQPRIKVTLPAVGRAIRNVEATNPPVKLQKIQRQIGVSTNTLKQFDNKRPGILRRLGIPALDLRIRSQADAEKFEALIDAALLRLRSAVTFMPVWHKDLADEFGIHPNYFSVLTRLWGINLASKGVLMMKDPNLNAGAEYYAARYLESIGVEATWENIDFVLHRPGTRKRGGLLINGKKTILAYEEAWRTVLPAWREWHRNRLIAEVIRETEEKFIQAWPGGDVREARYDLERMAPGHPCLLLNTSRRTRSDRELRESLLSMQREEAPKGTALRALSPVEPVPQSTEEYRAQLGARVHDIHDLIMDADRPDQMPELTAAVADGIEEVRQLLDLLPRSQQPESKQEEARRQILIRLAKWGEVRSFHGLILLKARITDERSRDTHKIYREIESLHLPEGLHTRHIGETANPVQVTVVKVYPGQRQRLSYEEEETERQRLMGQIDLAALQAKSIEFRFHYVVLEENDRNLLEFLFECWKRGASMDRLIVPPDVVKRMRWIKPNHFTAMFRDRLLGNFDSLDRGTSAVESFDALLREKLSVRAEQKKESMKARSKTRPKKQSTSTRGAQNARSETRTLHYMGYDEPRILDDDGNLIADQPVDWLSTILRVSSNPSRVIKIVKDKLTEKPDWTFGGVPFKLQEAIALKLLEQQSAVTGIPKLVDWGILGPRGRKTGAVWLELEGIENGEPLGKDDEPGIAALSLPQVLGAFIGVAEALKEIHQQGFAYNDIKPSNIVVNSEGGALLNDYESMTWMGGHTPAKSENYHPHRDYKNQATDVYMLLMTIGKVLGDFKDLRLTGDQEKLREFIEGLKCSYHLIESSKGEFSCPTLDDLIRKLKADKEFISAPTWPDVYKSAIVFGPERLRSDELPQVTQEQILQRKARVNAALQGLFHQLEQSGALPEVIGEPYSDISPLLKSGIAKGAISLSVRLPDAGQEMVLTPQNFQRLKKIGRAVYEDQRGLSYLARAAQASHSLLEISDRLPLVALEWLLRKVRAGVLFFDDPFLKTTYSVAPDDRGRLEELIHKQIRILQELNKAAEKWRGSVYIQEEDAYRTSDSISSGSIKSGAKELSDDALEWLERQIGPSCRKLTGTNEHLFQIEMFTWHFYASDLTAIEDELRIRRARSEVRDNDAVDPVFEVELNQMIREGQLAVGALRTPDASPRISEFCDLVVHGLDYAVNMPSSRVVDFKERLESFNRAIQMFELFSQELLKPDALEHKTQRLNGSYYSIRPQGLAGMIYSRLAGNLLRLLDAPSDQEMEIVREAKAILEGIQRKTAVLIGQILAGEPASEISPQPAEGPIDLSWVTAEDPLEALLKRKKDKKSEPDQRSETRPGFDRQKNEVIGRVISGLEQSMILSEGLVQKLRGHLLGMSMLEDVIDVIVRDMKMSRTQAVRFVGEVNDRFLDEMTRSETRQDQMRHSESGIRNEDDLFRNPQSAFSIPKNRSETRKRGPKTIPHVRLREFMVSHFDGPLILGGTGFVGSNLAEHLIRKESRQVAVPFRSKKTPSFQNLVAVERSLPQRAKKKLIAVDARRLVDPMHWTRDSGFLLHLKELFSKSSPIIHVAAQPNAKPRKDESAADFAVETLVTNVLFTKVIARLAAEVDRPVIYGSSAHVFALNPLFARPIEEPVTESTPIPLQPQTRELIAAVHARFNQYVTSYLRGDTTQSPVEFVTDFLTTTTIRPHRENLPPVTMLELLLEVEKIERLRKTDPTRAKELLQQFIANYPADLAFG